MKDYPLEVRCLGDDGGYVCAYFSKGHHDPAAFVEAVDRDHGDRCPVEKVEHGERRWACIHFADYKQCLMSPRAGTTRRGVFPVTIIEW